ncbi:uncharacterized protein ypel2b isoform X2 [Chanodichthys erythropterus]|uniref:uncharacterized protein ypel2b isoform X2 n=1 Tax=Chanodichthys erythropterus TaxID=933992 RepID=UPI00351EA5C4
MVTMTRSKTFQAYLPSCHRTYSCIHCRAHLANHDELISKSFQGSQGRAYLFNSVVNVGCGPAEERVLLTGLHAVADIYCENCKTTLGWKYNLTWQPPSPPFHSSWMMALFTWFTRFWIPGAVVVNWNIWSTGKAMAQRNAQGQYHFLSIIQELLYLLIITICSAVSPINLPVLLLRLPPCLCCNKHLCYHFLIIFEKST